MGLFCSYLYYVIYLIRNKAFWIKDPKFDLTYLTFGWLAVYFVFIVFEQYFAVILGFVVITSFIHRHYTFALVYG